MEYTDPPAKKAEGHTFVSVDDKFETYLMWKPTFPKAGERVPLAMVKWHWRAKATRTGNTGKCANDWTVSDKDGSSDVTGAPTTITPAYKGNFHTLPELPGHCD